MEHMDRDYERLWRREDELIPTRVNTRGLLLQFSNVYSESDRPSALTYRFYTCNFVRHPA